MFNTEIKNHLLKHKSYTGTLITDTAASKQWGFYWQEHLKCTNWANVSIWGQVLLKALLYSGIYWGPRRKTDFSSHCTIVSRARAIRFAARQKGYSVPTALHYAKGLTNPKPDFTVPVPYIVATYRSICAKMWIFVMLNKDVAKTLTVIISLYTCSAT